MMMRYHCGSTVIVPEDKDTEELKGITVYFYNMLFFSKCMTMKNIVPYMQAVKWEHTVSKENDGFIWQYFCVV